MSAGTLTIGFHPCQFECRAVLPSRSGIGGFWCFATLIQVGRATKMQFETLFAPARKKPVVAALIGCGEFGMSLIAQSCRMEGLTIRAVADLDPERVEASLRAAGYDVDLCDGRAAAEKAFTTDAIAICRSIDDLMALPIEIIVEATGNSEAGARFALAAIEAGHGVAMVSKEAECVVGPILAWKARAKGVPYTLIDGDQPSLLIGLVSWARVLGLPIIAAGKSSEYDYVLDVVSGTVTWTDRKVSAPGLIDAWTLGTKAPDTVAQRARLLADLPHRTAPDYCEMCRSRTPPGSRRTERTFMRCSRARPSCRTYTSRARMAGSRVAACSTCQLPAQDR